MIDVGSEWRTFSNEKSATDRSRVGQAEVNQCTYTQFNNSIKNWQLIILVFIGQFDPKLLAFSDFADCDGTPLNH